MNRHKKELLKNFTAEEIQLLEELDLKVRDLFSLILSEKSNYMGDNYADPKDLNKEVNPMSNSYIEKIKNKSPWYSAII